MRNPFDWNYLTSVPASSQVWNPWTITYFTIFALGLVATVIVNNLSGRIFPEHRLHRETLHKITYRAMWGWFTGLVFFGCRYIGLNFLGWELWLFVCLLAALGCIGYAVWWLRTKYPPRVAAYRKEQRRRAYLRPGSAAAAALTSNTRGGAVARAEREQRLDHADRANRATARRQPAAKK